MLLEYKDFEPIIYKQMINALENNISHAYLFDLNRNVYAENMINAFVKAILCMNHLDRDEYDSCIKCKRIDDGNYPELKKIYPDGQFIKKEQLDELQEKFSTKSIESDKKVYIIYEAEKLNLSAANSLLKFLEEPSSGVVAILLTNNSDLVLKTIYSRCRVLKFNSSRVEDFIEKNNIIKKVTISKIAFTLFLKENITENDENFVDAVINFWKLFENNGKKTIIYENSSYLNIFKEKEDVSNFIKCSILLYRDILNIKLSRKILYFDDYTEVLNFIASKNSLNKINKKLNVLLKKEFLANKNVNSNLFIDGIIIDMEEV